VNRSYVAQRRAWGKSILGRYPRCRAFFRVKRCAKLPPSTATSEQPFANRLDPPRADPRSGSLVQSRGIEHVAQCLGLAPYGPCRRLTHCAGLDNVLLSADSVESRKCCQGKILAKACRRQISSEDAFFMRRRTRRKVLFESMWSTVSGGHAGGGAGLSTRIGLSPVRFTDCP
jgi:hypothetical protein